MSSSEKKESGNKRNPESLDINFYQNVLDDCGFGIGCYDLKGIILYMNRTAAENVNQEIEGMIGKSVTDVFGNEVGEFVLNRIGKIKKEIKRMDYEDEVEINGIHRWFLSSYSPIKNDKEKLIGVQIVSADITQLHRIEKDLKQKNHFIESILDNLPIGLAVNKIKEGTATYMNKKFGEIYGWSENVIKDVSNFFQHVYPDPEYRKKIVDRVMTDIESGDPDRMIWQNIKITTSKNENRIVDAKNIPLFEQNLMISTVQDVTRREEALKQLRDSEMRYRLLVETSPYLIIIHDLDGIIKYANPATFELFNWMASEKSPLSIKEFIPSEDINKMIQRQKKREKGDRRKYKYEIRIKNPSDEILFLEVISTPIIRETKIVEILLVARDITEKKMADLEMEKKVKERTAELTEKNQQLEKMNKLFVGREFRVKELRDKIRMLEDQLKGK